MGRRRERATGGHCRSSPIIQTPATIWARWYIISVALDQGIELFERAIQIDPSNANAHFNLGSHRLMLGDFTGGWPEYEWRLQQANIELRSFPQPRWQGESLQGRSILLWAEQGFGDTLQFVRYAELVKQRGGQVTVECPE